MELELIRAGQIEFRRAPGGRPVRQGGKSLADTGKNGQKPGRAICRVVETVPVFPVEDMAGKFSGQQCALIAHCGSDHGVPAAAHAGSSAARGHIVEQTVGTFDVPEHKRPRLPSQ